jgi:RNA polymerase sigma-70 factor (ECF subfamily)
MQQTDQELIRRIQNQDADAFEIFFRRYRAMIQRHVARIVRHETVAEDLVQEVFLRVWTRAEQWSDRGDVRAWLYRIGTNLALNQLRSVRRRPQQPLEIFGHEPDREAEGSIPGWVVDAAALDPETAIELREQQKRFWHLIDTLPEAKREVFRLIYEAELDIQDIAETLGIPQGTVKSRLHYGKKRLVREWTQITTKGKSDEDL